MVVATIARLQVKFPEAFIVMSGDYNHVCLSKTLPTFKQFVDCTTRGDKTLDLLVDQTMTCYTSLPPTPQLSRGCLSPPEHQEAGILKLMEP